MHFAPRGSVNTGFSQGAPVAPISPPAPHNYVLNTSRQLGRANVVDDEHTQRPAICHALVEPVQRAGHEALGDILQSANIMQHAGRPICQKHAAEVDSDADSLGRAKRGLNLVLRHPIDRHNELHFSEQLHA